MRSAFRKLRPYTTRIVIVIGIVFVVTSFVRFRRKYDETFGNVYAPSVITMASSSIDPAVASLDSGPALNELSVDDLSARSLLSTDQARGNAQSVDVPSSLPEGGAFSVAPFSRKQSKPPAEMFKSSPPRLLATLLSDTTPEDPVQPISEILSSETHSVRQVSDRDGSEEGLEACPERNSATSGPESEGTPAPETHNIPHVVETSAGRARISISPSEGEHTPYVRYIDSANPADNPSDTAPKHTPFEIDLPITDAPELHQEDLPPENRSQQAVSAVHPVMTTVRGADLGHLLPAQDGLADQASRLISEGFSLAERGAFLTAQSRFVEGLALMAFVRDRMQYGQHSETLAEAMTALDESRDFSPTVLNQLVHVPQVISGHQTTVVQPTEAQKFSAIQVQIRYFAFARDQLVLSLGQNEIASMGIFALARIQSVLDGDHQVSETAASAKAIALYQASLATDAQNHRAANELGVLLARNRHFTEAETVWNKSLSARPTAEAWYNLSKLYGVTGQNELARSSKERFVELRDASIRRVAYETQDIVGPAIRWVDHGTFESHAAQLPIPGAPSGGYQTEKLSTEPQRTGNMLAQSFRKLKGLVTKASQEQVPQPITKDRMEHEVNEAHERDVSPGGLTASGHQGSCACAECSANFDQFGHGEYIGPHRLPHVPVYRLRVDDLLSFVYRVTGDATGHPYRISVGDQLRLESITATNLNIQVIVQPDGMITLRDGQVRAAGSTIDNLRIQLNKRFVESGVPEPDIGVIPIRINSSVEELRQTVDRRFGSGGQTSQTLVTPEGTIQLPAIGSVFVNGLSLDEVGREVEARYAEMFDGIEVTPILAERAPRFAYVVGEVNNPGRFTLEAPTSVMQGIALAGSWQIGAQLDNIVVLRRDQNWNLMAVKINLRAAFFGRDLGPTDDLWLRDNDIVVVPKRGVQWTGDLIEMFFTRGIYGVVPVSYGFSLRRNSVF